MSRAKVLLVSLSGSKPGSPSQSYLFYVPVPWVGPISQGSKTLNNGAYQSTLVSVIF